MVEWLILLAIVVILLFLGPKKIPALARGLGRTFGEFRRGREEGEQVARGTPGDARELAQAARRLGIPVEGKSEEDLRREIAARVQ
jgi:TatA/E family protein of Tat protein translocase